MLGQPAETAFHYEALHTCPLDHVTAQRCIAISISVCSKHADMVTLHFKTVDLHSIPEVKDMTCLTCISLI